MTPPTCPAGHTTTATDYCDTCGMPVAASAGAEATASGGPSAPTGGSAGAGVAPARPPAGGETSAAGVQSCPNCSADNPADALFCENCGYDFTTGTMPRPPDSGPSSLDLASVPTSTAGSAASAPPASMAPAVEVEWVAELWVDPDWYAEQESDDPCPSPGLPVVIPLAAQSVLVGRPSASRNIHPEIDCSADVGVSRRQAQLTTDGQRWWVEDLQSSNGTYVGAASGPLPTDPVPPGQRRELAEDDRVYLGAWTRLVVRRATPEEKAGQV